MIRPRKHNLGRSVEGQRLSALELTGRPGQPRVIVFGGFHGDEPKSVYVVQRLIDELQANTKKLKRPKTGLVLVPVVNPDGYERRKRRNAHKVDINRNFPTANWEHGNPRSRMYGGPRPTSEPETRAVVRLIEQVKPDAIITIHSINRNRYCNNYDGPGRRLAEWLSRHNGYPVTSTIGYPTPGSFGTWAGVERGIPTITLELPSHHSARKCWEDNREALLCLECE